jgi:glucosamine--fructose-6-phosphate aminotransferase (isomerizing)
MVIQTEAGAEISVASTKAYTAQCGIMFLFAIKLALVKGKIDPTRAAELCDSLITDVPLSIRSVLDKKEEIKNHAKEFINAKNLFFIGRGVDFALASEASLKLKEISYIHSEAYAAGELKHGTISLISHATHVIALLTDSNICQKTISAIREVKSRGATVTALCSSSIADSESVPCDTLLKIPNAPQGFELFPASTLFQLFAYYVSAEMGHSVDKPRNLAKSVTVE